VEVDGHVATSDNGTVPCKIRVFLEDDVLHVSFNEGCFSLSALVDWRDGSVYKWAERARAKVSQRLKHGLRDGCDTRRRTPVRGNNTNRHRWGGAMLAGNGVSVSSRSYCLSVSGISICQERRVAM
jgi:hypothetical protein